MAMKRFLTALVFCEAPLDAAYCGTSVTTTGAAKLVSGANPAVVMKPSAPEANKEARRQVGYELAFDGLNCFETVVFR